MCVYEKYSEMLHCVLALIEEPHRRRSQRIYECTYTKKVYRHVEKGDG